MRLETTLEPDLSHPPGVQEDANATDRAKAFQQIIATLPDAQREALQLAYYRGLSQREIAAKTGIPLGTIKTRLELAVRKVRAAILALGGEQEWSLVRA
jgi:RNA polymerase sigma-70 factor (ECF subfamily)